MRSSLGYRDFATGLDNLGLAIHLGAQDIRLRYRRTVLGPIWTLISSVVFVGILGTVYSILFGLNLRDNMPFIAAGYFVWMTIFAISMESCAAFTSAEQVIKSLRIPFSTHIFRSLHRNVIILFHMLPVGLATSLIFGVQYELIDLPLFLWGLATLVLNGFWVSMICAIISTRYRDFQQVVATILQILFFITPIFWPVSALSNSTNEYAWLAVMVLATFNPAFQQIEVMRAPLISADITLMPYLVLTASGIVGTAIAVLFLGAKIRRISVWL